LTNDRKCEVIDDLYTDWFFEKYRDECAYSDVESH